MNVRHQLPVIGIPLIIISLVFLGLFFTNFRKEKESPKYYYGAQNIQEVDEGKNINEQKSAEISTLINATLKNKQGKYAVVIRDLKSNLGINYAQDESFGAASIYKLAVMYKTYDEIEKGKIKKEDVSEALRLMITISDNDSAIFLAEKLGWTNIDKFLKNNGILNFNLIDPNSPNATASDTASILEKIYDGKAVSKQASEEMLNLLIGQKINDRIPKYLPKDIIVAHKTGEIETHRHDAGIVFGKKSDYIFVFLSETPNTQIASETIALLSKEIFDILENQ